MSSKNYFFKHSMNKRNDPRVKFIPTLESKAVYYMLSELACQCDADGAFVVNEIQLTNEQISHAIGIDVVQLRKAFKDMKRTGMLSENGHGPFLTDYAYEQVSRDEQREAWKSAKAQQRSKEVNEDVHEDVKKEVHEDVFAKSKSQIRDRVLLLLSKSAKEKLQATPQWIDDAIKIANTKHLDNPDQYITGILRNWLTEGRKETQRKPSMKKKATSKQVQPKLEGDALKVAREKAAKELLK